MCVWMDGAGGTNPWTQGKSDRHLINTKQIMTQDPATLHAYLSHLSDALAVYVCHQIDCGAQVRLFFHSGAPTWNGDQSPLQPFGLDTIFSAVLGSGSWFLGSHENKKGGHVRKYVDDETTPVSLRFRALGVKTNTLIFS